MQNIKPVPILLDKERHLLYDVNALIDLGDELGLNLLTPEGWQELTGKTVRDDRTGEETFIPVEPTFRRVRAIVWAGLRHEDETLTVRQVGAMLDPTNLGPVIEAYQSAWEVADAPSPQNGSGELVRAIHEPAPPEEKKASPALAAAAQS
jgi:hypothetical protein